MVATKRGRDYPRKLARKLRKVRTRAGSSQKELGVTDRALNSQYETGKRQPSLPVLLKYARLAKVTMDVLVDDKVKLPLSSFRFYQFVVLKIR
jgi:transcriptional regulator with XRE-family HTH domain